MGVPRSYQYVLSSRARASVLNNSTSIAPVAGRQQLKGPEITGRVRTKSEGQAARCEHWAVWQHQQHAWYGSVAESQGDTCSPFSVKSGFCLSGVLGRPSCFLRALHISCIGPICLRAAESQYGCAQTFCDADWEIVLHPAQTTTCSA